MVIWLMVAMEKCIYSLCTPPRYDMENRCKYFGAIDVDKSESYRYASVYVSTSEKKIDRSLENRQGNDIRERNLNSI